MASLALTSALLLGLVVGGRAGLAANGSKFWTDSMLEWGMAVETPEQFRPLLAKLESGQAINVMAWGSSVVASHGGCYNEVSKQFMIKTRGYPPENCDLHEYGWLTLILRDINATWPAYNPEHLLANLGRSGAFLEVLLKTCYEASVPDPVDLIILENLGGLGHPFSLEQTITALLRLAAARDPQAPRPTIIMINRVECITRDWCNHNCTSKKAGFEHVLTKEHRTPDIQIEIAKTYGINLISIADFLNTGMEKGLFPRVGVKACLFLAAMMKDHVHPNHLGKRLYADLIWKALERAQRQLKKGGAVSAVGKMKSQPKGQEEDEDEEYGKEKSDHAGRKAKEAQHDSGRQRGLSIPSHPILPKGHKVFVKRCYMQVRAYGRVRVGT
ncbi:hypothetical protein HYH03_007705 [Edaphochlamys debaryana]|uniref:SGNH hydrolase-type esterase domain-containing protein n=1 Tax=Edaphochlamys debaryana TaxID=47281 RepID=A0A835Y4M2_9CHLO|nr:hypothetical protein HYH03_007705 [Edaphochlamys debaryana]|eukprot:KAG2494061.1 hypothetical protein HYH03_007705 [Edaphochlamys debaryana]